MANIQVGMKIFIDEFILGLRSCWQGVRFIVEHRFYWYFCIPAILMLIIYYLGNIILRSEIEADLSNMNGIVWYFIHVIINISIAILLMKFAKYIVVIVLSPLLSHVSQRCKQLIGEDDRATPSGKHRFRINYQQITKDAKRGVRLALRNILWEYFFFVLILIIASIFWDDPRHSPLFYLTIIIGFYYYGFSFMDYDSERRHMNEQESIHYVRSHRGLAMAIGMIYSLLILVPIDMTKMFIVSEKGTVTFGSFLDILLHLGLWICASIAPILAIVSASIATENLKKREAMAINTDA